jgi:hypothetical protein
MPGLVHKWLLLAVVVSVLAVFLAPTIDLPETALRASQNAQRVMICIAILAIDFLFARAFLCFRFEPENLLSMFNAPTSPLLCTFLC